MEEDAWHPAPVLYVYTQVYPNTRTHITHSWVWWCTPLVTILRNPALKRKSSVNLRLSRATNNNKEAHKRQYYFLGMAD